MCTHPLLVLIGCFIGLLPCSAQNLPDTTQHPTSTLLPVQPPPPPSKPDSLPTEHKRILQQLARVTLHGYGSMNYYRFDWQTDTAKRNSIDNERFILDFGYKWTDKIRMNAELEIEHGGTGSAVEFDRFEEFGEFEFDISKGGEVLLEQMNLEFTLHRSFQIKVGRIKVPFGLMFERDEPIDYLTAINSEMETQILPENWTENGIMLFGELGKNRRLTYHLGLVNGLDGSAFNSANWIKRGNQARFEMANAESFAGVFRLDYRPIPRLVLGLAAYGGNTTNNRPKPDLKVNAPIGLSSVHLLYRSPQLRISAMGLYGALQNSEALSVQNRNLSNNLNVKRTPVGAAAIGGFAEIGAVLVGKQGLAAKHPKSELILYGRFDYYDTMFKTEGVIFNNPRWARHSFTGGLVYQIIPAVHLKFQYSLRKVGAPAPSNPNGGTREQTTALGFAFEF